MVDSNLNDIDGVPLYKPNDPYHFDFDNKPIKSLAERDKVLLGFINSNTKTLKESAGDLGSLPARLDQSLDSNGNLKVNSIDESMHSIAMHEDARKDITPEEVAYYNSLGYTVSSNVKYVRTIEHERAKLSRIEDNANNLKVSVKDSDGFDYIFENGIVNIENSNTINCILSSPNSIKFESKFPVEVAHRHYYNIQPSSIDNLNYVINGIGSFKEGSLRVYINGFKIENCQSSDCPDIEFSKYPTFQTTSSTTPSWKKIYFVEDSNNAKFTFSSSLGQLDRVLVDYDIVLI